MSSIANPLTSPPASPATSSTTAPPADPTDPLASESTFLTLLVSQLQNQDPTNPIDSTTFVSQLTSYSQLEQLIGIHSDTTTLATSTTTTTPPATTGS
ncbi:MAG: flagellar hook capping FlgD N-terminal domain-containing protein [Bryobacteraceae bacterium]|jgi:flagellar basal-body rod modification protein FlgD